MSLKSFGYYDLIDACGEAGCPVCRLLRRDVARLLDSLLYEYATDGQTQARFRASRGLCAEHAAGLLQNDNALAIAVLYEQSLHEILDVMSRPALREQVKRGFGRLFAAGAGSGLADALEPAQICLACETRATSEAMLIRALRDGLADDKFLAAFRASSGLCIEHFRQGLRQTDDANKAALLIEIQTDIWTRLRAELNEFMRKNDYTHRDEVMGAEGDSWRRVVKLVSGERD